jgi:hypothetical protein
MKTKIIILSFCFITLFSSSCNDYLDVNFDPSFPQTAESFAVLPPMISQMVRGEAFDIRFVGQYVQNWASTAKSNVWDLHGYAPGSDAGGEKWRSHYWSIGKNIDLIIEESTAKQRWDYVGVAKAIRAWSWQTTTDVNADMILNQAWEPNRYVFTFESQEEVYKEVVRLSEDALKDLDRTDGNVSETGLGRGDIVYKGNRDKWKKFVYATLARNAHHLSNKSTYNPTKVIEYVDKSLASNADNFLVPHLGTNSNDGNFFGPTRNNLRTYRPTNFFVNLLNGKTLNGVVDPRLALMHTVSPDTIYRGIEPVDGDPTNVNNDKKRIPLLWGVSPTVTDAKLIPGKYIFKDNVEHPLVTFSELQFIKAEAAFKKGDKPLAFDAFKKGIIAHMDFTKVVAKDRDTYMASKAIPKTADELTLSDIMLQKYISLWVHGALETWVDMRRHAYNPAIYKGFKLPTTLYIDNSGKPAQRLRPRYNSEYVWNRESLNAIGGNDANYHTYEIWFAKP